MCVSLGFLQPAALHQHVYSISPHSHHSRWPERNGYLRFRPNALVAFFRKCTFTRTRACVHAHTLVDMFKQMCAIVSFCWQSERSNLWPCDPDAQTHIHTHTRALIDTMCNYVGAHKFVDTAFTHTARTTRHMAGTIAMPIFCVRLLRCGPAWQRACVRAPFVHG